MIATYREYEFYDVTLDEERICLMMTTQEGTFHTTIPLQAGEKTRARREAFKQYVEESIRLKQLPHEIQMG